MNNITRYPYHDEYGTLLYTKIRETTPEGKKFHWEREVNGVKVFDLQGCRKVLYRLPLLMRGLSEGRMIFLVEGEKDADTLLAKTLIATTAPGTLEWKEEFTELLQDAQVVILYDYDNTGIKRRDLLCKNLFGRVKSLRVVELPGLEPKESHGQDITDWFEMEHTIEELKKLVCNTPEYQPKPDPNKLHAISLEKFLSLELPEREMILEPFLPTQGLVMLVAKRGVGKTHVALGIAYAIANGGTFLHWTAPKPKKVLYIDGEMPATLMQERLRMIESITKQKPSPGFFKLITPDQINQTMPDLSSKKGRDLLEELINDRELVTIDNISCLFRSGSENDSESWQEAQEWALDLRRRGKSVLFVHHAGKSGHQRGTSKKEDILDAVIILKHPADYKPEEGARFEVHFDKARHFAGDDASSFIAHLKEENNQWYWELSNIPAQEEILRIAEMKNAGMTIKQIIQETKLTKAQVEWRLKKAKEQELLN